MKKLQGILGGCWFSEGINAAVKVKALKTSCFQLVADPDSCLYRRGRRPALQAALWVALFLVSLGAPGLAEGQQGPGGNIFITGHPIFARGGQNGFDKVVMDYLRDGDPISSYEIAVIGSGVSSALTAPFSGVGVPSCSYCEYDWSAEAKAVDYDINTTYYNTDDLINGTVQWCDVLSKDCLVILSYGDEIPPWTEGTFWNWNSSAGFPPSHTFTANTGDLSDSGVDEIFTKRGDIICAFNSGMDLLVLGGGDSPDYYSFLAPSAVSPPLFQAPVSYNMGVAFTWDLAVGYGVSPTIAGCQIGIGNDNVDAATCTPCDPNSPSSCTSGGMMLEESLQVSHFGQIGTHLSSSSSLLTVMTTHDIDENGSRYYPVLNEPSDVVVSMGAKSINLPVTGPVSCSSCPIPPAVGGNIFITGHPLFARQGHNGFDKVIMDYLRGGSGTVNDYDIAIIGSGVAQNYGSGYVPFSGLSTGQFAPSPGSIGWTYDWSGPARAAGYDAQTTYYNTDDLINGTARWCDVLSKDCLVILSYEGPNYYSGYLGQYGDLSDSGVDEVFARRADIICAFNSGMDLLVLGGGDRADYYDFLGSSSMNPPLFQAPVSYSTVPQSWFSENGVFQSPTIPGCQIGIRNDNVISSTCTPCDPLLDCQTGWMLEEVYLFNHFGQIGAGPTQYSPLLTVMTTQDIDQNDSRYLPDLHEPSDVVVSLGGTNIQLPVPPGPTLCGIGNCTAPLIEEFRRGDSNIDSSVNIADVLHVLFGVFGGNALQCLDASDSNDDEVVDISDALHLVMYLFLGGPPPPTPGPVNCGPDSTGGGVLDCQNYTGC